MSKELNKIRDEKTQEAIELYELLNIEVNEHTDPIINNNQLNLTENVKVTNNKTDLHWTKLSINSNSMNTVL